MKNELDNVSRHFSIVQYFSVHPLNSHLEVIFADAHFLTWFIINIGFFKVNYFKAKLCLRDYVFREHISTMEGPLKKYSLSNVDPIIYSITSSCYLCGDIHHQKGLMFRSSILELVLRKEKYKNCFKDDFSAMNNKLRRKLMTMAI